MIEVKNLSKKYRRRRVLDGVTFSVEKGKVTCLAGLNGSGKSTVLKAIMGLIPIDEGVVLVDGIKAGTDLYEKVAFIPDHLTMFSTMKLSSALRLMADFYPNTWNPDRADHLMRFFQLNDTDKISNLSAGSAAKFNLVLGLSQNTDFVLMDEPFAGIDMFSREKIAEIFMSEMIEDRGVLITTHEIDEIEHLIDRTVLLKDGVIHMEFDAEQMRLERNKSVIDVMREVYHS